MERWKFWPTGWIYGLPNFRSNYEDKKDILENERKYSQSATEIDEAIDDLTEHGPPQHAWNQVAPGAAEQQTQAIKMLS